MSCATDEKLAECGLGYRTPYILDAIQQVLTGSLDLEALLDCNEAFSTTKNAASPHEGLTAFLFYLFAFV